MKLALPLAAAALLAAGLGIGFAMSGNPASERATDPIRGEEIRAYLLENPEVIIEAINAYQAREEEAELARARQALSDNLERYTDIPGAFVAGNPDGDVTLVEFFDYHCGFCKRALPAVMELIDSDTNLRVVFVELPILAPESEIAARASLASIEQGQYMELHAALMESEGRLTLERIVEIAKETGLDTEKLQADMAAPKVNETLTHMRRLAAELGIGGTPTFLVDDEVIVGFQADAVRASIRQARAGG